MNLFGKDRLDAELLLHRLLRIIEGLVNALDGLLQVLDVAILGINVLLPIELIDVERMGIVDIVVATEAAKVGDEALSGLDIVIMEGPALPLGKREGDFQMSSGEITRLESRRALGAVEVIVEAGGPGNKEGSADADQVNVGFEVVLEGRLAKLESLLELQLVGEDGAVSAVFKDVLGGKSSEGIGAVERAGHLCRLEKGNTYASGSHCIKKSEQIRS